MTIKLSDLSPLIDPPWDGKRQPYGDTDPCFDIETARVVLANLEHAELSQGTSDTLFVELRMACAHVERVQPLLAAAPALIECVRTELEMDAAGKRAAKVRFAWSRAHGDPAETPMLDEVARAERLYFAAKAAHEAALVRVSP
jgi:hypothetical protein